MLKEIILFPFEAISTVWKQITEGIRLRRENKLHTPPEAISREIKKNVAKSEGWEGE